MLGIAFCDVVLDKDFAAGVAGCCKSHDDLAQYKIIERQPVQFSYNGMLVTSVPPPSSGGVALAQIFRQLALKNYDDLDAVQRKHVLIESMRRAYRDRAEYLGDSDFVNVPVQKLMSIEHAEKIIADSHDDKATPSDTLQAIAVDKIDGADTTHFSVLDAAGNRVAATLSINYPFGSGFVAKGTGVLLNDEMDDFSSKPGTPNVYGLVGAEANAIAPAKRMLSSMSPSFAEYNNRVVILGTPGGSRIITMVLIGLLQFYQGEDSTAIVNAPRLHHQYLPDKVFYEPGAIPQQQLIALQHKGHHLQQLDAAYGNMQTIVMDKLSGEVNAASDARGSGSVTVFRLGESD